MVAIFCNMGDTDVIDVLPKASHWKVVSGECVLIYKLVRRLIMGSGWVEKLDIF